MGGSTKLMSSGAGGVILTTPGSIASDVTVNLPTQNSTLAINGPAFIAYAGSSTALSNAAWTKVLFDTEVSDTNNNFASSTFTPTVAGYYQINALVTVIGSTSAETAVAIYKNGSQYYVGTDIVATMYTISASGLIYFNGTTDFIDIRFYIGTTGKSTQTGIQNTSFNGFLARAA